MRTIACVHCAQIVLASQTSLSAQVKHMVIVETDAMYVARRQRGSRGDSAPRSHRRASPDIAAGAASLSAASQRLPKVELVGRQPP